MKVPLHSIVMVQDENQAKRFPDYELLSFDKMSKILFDEPFRPEFEYEVFNELKNQVISKTLVGERSVVLLRDSFHQNKIKNLAKDFGVELVNLSQSDFLIVSKTSDILSEYSGITVIPDIHANHTGAVKAIDWAMSRSNFIIFLGDTIDYGKKPIEVVNLVYDLVRTGSAAFVIGNHEMKIYKWLVQYRKNNVRVRLNAGNQVTVDALLALSSIELKKFELKLKTLISLGHNVFRVQNLSCSHGAIHPDCWNLSQTRLSGVLQQYALYGELDPRKPFHDNGFPNSSYHWVSSIPNQSIVMVGHKIRSYQIPLIQKNDQGGQACFLDTGSGKGGVLTTCDLKFENGQFRISNFNQHD